MDEGRIASSLRRVEKGQDAASSTIAEKIRPELVERSLKSCIKSLERARSRNIGSPMLNSGS